MIFLAAARGQIYSITLFKQTDSVQRQRDCCAANEIWVFVVQIHSPKIRGHRILIKIWYVVLAPIIISIHLYVCKLKINRTNYHLR